MTYQPEYQRTKRGIIFHAYELAEGSTLRISAENVVRERSGVHAKVFVGLIEQSGARHMLTYDVINADRDKERVHLANAASDKLSNVGELTTASWGKPQMKHALDYFCAGLWMQQVGTFDFAPMAGALIRSKPKMAVGSYIIEGGGTMMFAPPGLGKSFAGYAMMVSLDAGLSTIFDIERPMRAGVINIERSAMSVSARLGDINAALGLPRDRPLTFLNARGYTLNDIYDAARKGVEDHGLEVLCLDSLSRAGMGDLKDDVAGNRIMDALNRLVPTWFCIAHTPRADASHTFGTVMFDAAADLQVQMLSQRTNNGSTVGIGLQVTKANDVRHAPLFVFALDFDDMGLTGIRKARASEFPEIAAGKKQGLEAEIKEYLLAMPWRAANDIAEILGRNRSNVSTVLNNSADFIKKKEGNKVMYAVTTERGDESSGNGWRDAPAAQVPASLVAYREVQPKAAQ